MLTNNNLHFKWVSDKNKKGEIEKVYELNKRTREYKEL